MFSFLAHLLAPPLSLTGIPGTWITDEERRLLEFASPVRLDPPVVRRMGLTSLDMLAAGGTYASSLLLREALQRLKYRGVRALAEELGALLRRAAVLLPPREECVLCPVPLHWTRRFDRGFNQAAMLARVVGPSMHWRVVECLARVRSTGFQAHRSASERRSALREAFVPCMHPLPRTIILVDDVATTGTTLDACARVLKQHGAQEVWGLVVALGGH